ncbi:hypothetical protein ACE38W_00470 [Chitinophaga sp. Hz27]|uniref:hypothetical protein n=1 Tax=Chitinophaga sp. Hz27 TaxID=3347169 RepID=UPI0035DB8596
MNAIDNSNLINYCRSGCDITSFLPTVAYTYDAGAKTVAVTDNTTFGNGDTLKKVHIKVLDQFGGEVRGTITATGTPGKQIIDVSSLNVSKGLSVNSTVISNAGFVADGSAVNIGAAGSLSRWNKRSS